MNFEEGVGLTATPQRSLPVCVLISCQGLRMPPTRSRTRSSS